MNGSQGTSPGPITCRCTACDRAIPSTCRTAGERKPWHVQPDTRGIRSERAAHGDVVRVAGGGVADVSAHGIDLAPGA